MASHPNKLDSSSIAQTHESISKNATDKNTVIEDRELTNALDLAELERQRLGFELHDGLIQHLVGARMLIEVIRSDVEQGKNARLIDIDAIDQALSQAIEDGRALISDLYPALQENAEHIQQRLAELCEHLSERAERFGMRLSFLETASDGASAVPLVSKRAGAAIYRFVQEGINNAIKHSQGTRIDVSLRIEHPYLVAQVQDNGIGIQEILPKTDHYGLSSLKYRAELLGGSMSLTAAAQGGTCLQLQVPLDKVAIRTNAN